MQREVVVIGGGPAGLSASIEMARRGIRVLLIDENKRPGGQLFKQIHKFFGSKSHNAGTRGFDIGKKLLEETSSLGVEVWLNSAAIGIFEGNRVAVLREGETITIEAKKILICTGGSENAMCFPGSTLPGVMGAGAAQTMINVNQVIPGNKILMIGSGNVGLIVSYQMLQAGAQVVGIVELMPRIGGYGVHASKIRRAGVPLYLGHTIVAAEGKDKVEAAIIGKVDENRNIISGSEIRIPLDVICIAAGLKPLAELSWMAGLRHEFIPELGGWMPIHNDDMESSVPGIYVAGDTAGVEEASTAMDEGRLAGVSIAHSMNRMDAGEALAAKEEIRTRLAALRMGSFGTGRQIAKDRVNKLGSEYK